MPKTEKIECDHCGQDLTSTGNMPAFRLVLSAERLPHTSNSNIIFTVLVSPPIDHDHYFCGLGCLREWIKPKATVTND